MIVQQYHVDAFASALFAGNPAAVMLLNTPLSDTLMQSIAAENNLSETAFVTLAEPEIGLRWFTPSMEVDLCGHATLASAHILFSQKLVPTDTIHFATRSGILPVTQLDQGYEMDFPVRQGTPCSLPPEIAERVGVSPVHCECWGDDYLVVLDKQTVLNFDRTFIDLPGTGGIILTAPGDGECDFQSRFFGFKALGIVEDPVTGSIHCQLLPYWAKQLNKTECEAWQVSRRGGKLHCRLRGDRVFLRGLAQTYSRAEVDLTGLNLI